MHCLHGLQQFGFTFQLKGGTSLSKGHGIIGRFSEDIDILIEPPAERDVKTGKNHDKPAHIQSRKDFYDWLAQSIKIDGIATVERDADFDDIPKYRSAGLKLTFPSTVEAMEGLATGCCPKLASTPLHQTSRGTSVRGPMTTPRARSRSSTTGPRLSLAMTRATPSRSCKRWRRSSVISRLTAAPLLRHSPTASTRRCPNLHWHRGLQQAQE